MPQTVVPLQDAFRVAWAKLHLFTLTAYDRILYLDSDVLLIKDISPIFQVDAFASVSLSCDSRLDLAGINGGILLIKPNATQYAELLALAAQPSETDWRYSEQELLSVYFVWMHPELFVPLSTHFMTTYRALDDDGLLPLRSGGRHWLFRRKAALDLLTRVYSVHFVCGSKPWELSPNCSGSPLRDAVRCAAVRMWHQHAREAGVW
jgi:alpha-N-acetylglucosamine transferase